MKIRYLLAVAVAASSAPAFAQNFTGPRVEANFGLVETTFDGEVDGEEGSDKLESIQLGGEVGFDVQMGNSFVVGGYAGALFRDDEICEELFGEDEICAGTGRTFTIGARAGVPVAKSFLLYGKAGYTNTQLKASYEDFEDSIDDFSETESMDGLHIGAGFELAPGTSGVYIKGEYTYTMYKGGDEIIEDTEISADAKRHQALVGVGIRF